MIIKIAFVGLALCMGFSSAHPSAAEFNLFCRILAKANDLMYGPDYVYDENVDRETIQEMTVLYNATTDDMKDFRKTLWVTKDFFEAHPPPTQPESRKKAHSEIGNLIKEGEKKIEENQKIALEVNEIIKKARLSVVQGIFGEHVKGVPKDEKNLTEILNNVESIFNHHNSPSSSCGNNSTTKAGKTLLNDFFCVCVGDGIEQSAGPCSPHILPSNYGNKNTGGWKKIKIKNKEALHFNQSFKQIEKACAEELVREVEPVKDMSALLDEYVGMIWNGTAADNGAKEKKFFGHSGRKYKEEVKQCDGSGYNGIGFGKDAANAQICVDYASHQNKDGKTYNITWHEKFKNYTTIMKDTKKIEERILKNRADLLLLKSQAWVAYNRESDDETTNLDDMNVSNLFDATQPPPSFPSLLFLFFFCSPE